MQAAGGSGKVGNGPPAKGQAAKSLTIQEYKRRLKDNLKTLRDNFDNLITTAKVQTNDDVHKNTNGRMAEHVTTKYEMQVRAALIVRASDELQKLTNDLKEFLILHDFNFLTQAISNAETECEERIRVQMKKHNDLRIDLAKTVHDIDRELHEHFSLRP